MLQLEDRYSNGIISRPNHIKLEARIMTKWVARGQAFGFAMLLAACADADPLGPSETYEGWFQMDGVDDRRLPFVVSSEGECQILYMGGSINLNGSGDFQLEYDRTAEICNGESVGASMRVMYGTYRISGEQIHFEPDGGEQILSGVYRSHQRIDESTIRAGTIEIEIDARTFVFMDLKSRMP